MKRLCGNARPLWLAVLAAMALRQSALGQTTCAPYNDQATSFSSNIDFSSLSPAITTGDISSAISYWTGSCGESGSDFPRMSTGSSGGIRVTVNLVNGRSTNAIGTCGEVQRFLNSSNQLARAEITLWTMRADGTLCQEHYVDVLAHEIGHILGFDNAPSSCAGRIMGPQAGLEPRTVGSEECNGIDDRWITNSERESCGTSCAGDGEGPCGV